ncbi:MAG: serine protease, partial [Bacteroidota bacterium]|nr:serine protease [Bacteroidota bacterium]
SINSTDTIIVGIVDTGIDYTHEDLSSNIWVNPGETGIDGQGNDKITNGIDDDGNGFIDDWRGWDFGTVDSAGWDNDPMPGNPHGTHVAGTVAAVINNGIGIAGVAKNVKLMPVKIGDDNENSKSVLHSYDGILYAASMGAEIINCSWGGSTKTQSEQEILEAAQKLGALVVAAAGNNGEMEPFYPASYKDVISVAAVNQDDKKVYFSNYHNTVDVSAPGFDIYATYPGNNYISMDGTSMASPIVTGTAALVKLRFPNMTPVQISEQIKQTCDNIDTINSSYIGKIGKGRINAYKAVTMDNARSIVIDDYSVTDEGGDNVPDANENIYISLKIENVLAQVQNAKMRTKALSFLKPNFIKMEETIGDMNTLESRSLDSAICFTIPTGMPLDYQLDFEVEFYDDKGIISKNYISLIVLPSWRTMSRNDISVTFNSIGNIGFNDYSSNEQGIGFTYKNSSNILFEGALMIGDAVDKVSNCARGEFPSSQDDNFGAETNFKVYDSPDIQYDLGLVTYRDKKFSSTVGVKVEQRVYQPKAEEDNNYVIVYYKVTNTSGADIDSLFTGLFFDWDIGPSGANNQAFWEDQYKFGYMQNMIIDTLPLVGVKLLSGEPDNYFAIDNDGANAENPGIYDSFELSEKWMMLSSGLARKTSGVTDASMVISGGPIALKNGASEKFGFALMSGYSLDELKQASVRARQTYIETEVNDNNVNSVSESQLQIFPNPNFEGKLNIEINLNSAQKSNLYLYNSLGVRTAIIFRDTFLPPGKSLYRFDSIGLSAGAYFLVLENESGNITAPVLISK